MNIKESIKSYPYWGRTIFCIGCVIFVIWGMYVLVGTFERISKETEEINNRPITYYYPETKIITVSEKFTDGYNIVLEARKFILGTGGELAFLMEGTDYKVVQVNHTYSFLCNLQDSPDGWNCILKNRAPIK